MLANVNEWDLDVKCYTCFLCIDFIGSTLSIALQYVLWAVSAKSSKRHSLANSHVCCMDLFHMTRLVIHHSSTPDHLNRRIICDVTFCSQCNASEQSNAILLSDLDLNSFWCSCVSQQYRSGIQQCLLFLSLRTNYRCWKSRISR